MSSYAASTSSLMIIQSSSATSPRKDYSSALASLQSSYGFGGAPIVVSQSPAQSASTRRTKVVSAPSVSFTAAPRATKTKEFSDALANLQSSYGFGGASIVAPQSSSTRRAKKSTSSSSSTPSTSTPKSKSTTPFAKLQSLYGFSGAPVLPSTSSFTSRPQASSDK